MSNTKRLSGKRVLLTAAGQGIGRASALAMANEGAKVYATDINMDLLKKLKEDDTTGNIVDVFELDVLSSKEVIEAAVQRAQPIDVLMNCAGVVHNGTILDCSEDDWDLAFNLNCRGMFRMMKATIPGMLEEQKHNGRKGGSIINMASAVSSVIGAPNRFVYGSSKAAVVGMTKAVAKDFITQNIRCNCICPGTVDSPSLHDRLKATGDYDAAMKQFVARQPMGRLGKPEEIAALVVYLASDESSFTTGQAHIIDGGWAS